MLRDIDIYCELDFIKSFLESCPPPAHSFEREANKRMHNWDNIYDLLNDKVNLHVKARIDELYEEVQRETTTYPEQLQLMLRKWQAYADGNQNRLCIDDYPDDLSDIGDNSTHELNAIFMIEDPDGEKTEILRKKGIFSLTNTFILESGIHPEVQSLRQGEKENWQFLKRKAKHPCNSLILIDLYILQRKEDNLYVILDSLLPEKLDVTFQVTICTKEPPEVKNDYQSFFKNLYDEIMKYLKEIRPDLAIDLSIVRTLPNQAHDRQILSNAIWINSPGGLDLFVNTTPKKNSKKHISTKTTDVYVRYPKFPDNEHMNKRETPFYSYNKYLDLAKNAIDSGSCKDENRSIFGSGENRLLED